MDIHQTKDVGAQTATISQEKGTTGLNDENPPVMDKMVSEAYYEYKDHIHDKLIDALIWHWSKNCRSMLSGSRFGNW
jgi:hypothetical protein